MKPSILAAFVALLAACGSDTGETANVCEKSVPAQCPDPWAPTPEHYDQVRKFIGFAIRSDDLGGE